MMTRYLKRLQKYYNFMWSAWTVLLCAEGEGGADHADDVAGAVADFFHPVIFELVEGVFIEEGRLAQTLDYGGMAGEGEGHAVEGEAEGADPAAVHADRNIVGVEAREVGDGLEEGLLDGVTRGFVAADGPAVEAGEGKHTGVLAGAVVMDGGGRLF